MALALRVPVMAIVTASRCRALLSNFRRRIPYSLESVRARGSYCGSSFLPHRLLAIPAQWSRLRPLGLSGLSSSSLYDFCTPWLRLLRTPPSSYGVGLGTHYFSSRNVATQAAVITTPSPKIGASLELVKELWFEQLEQHFIDENKSTATLYRHQKTGAEIMSVTNDDENKVFGIVFRTPPYVTMEFSSSVRPRPEHFVKSPSYSVHTVNHMYYHERLHRNTTHIGTQCGVRLKKVSIEGANCRTA